MLGIGAKATLGKLLGFVLGDKGQEVLFRCIDKVIPMNKEQKAQLEVELAKAEIESDRVDLDTFKEKKGIITRVFHLGFPFMVLVLTWMYIVEFKLRVQQYQAVGEWITVSIVPAGLEIIVIVFLSLLMPKKILEPLMKIVFKYLTDKIEYARRFK